MKKRNAGQQIHSVVKKHEKDFRFFPVNENWSQEGGAINRGPREKRCGGHGGDGTKHRGEHWILLNRNGIESKVDGRNWSKEREVAK